MDRRLAVVIVLSVGVSMESNASARAAEGLDRRAVDAAAVARLPYPGTIVPGAFAFTPDGRALTYLKSESVSLSRVLWRVEIPEGTPRVVARPPGGGGPRVEPLRGRKAPPRAATAPGDRDNPGHPARGGRPPHHPP